MRVGVVGTGRHANNALYPSILEAGLDLVAVCARTPERAASTAARWGAGAHHTSVADMLAAGGLDGVVVAVPPAAYRPILTHCIEAGIPVFCEKPGGQSASELRELAALAAEARTEVVVGYMKRFAPAYQRAREVIGSADFGSPSLAHFTFAMGRVDEYLADLRHYLIDNPVHMIDLARYLLGEIDEISAVLNVVPTVGLSVSLVARTDSGATCSFDFCTTASFTHRGEFAEVYGRGDSVVVDNVDTCTYRPADGPAQVWRPNYTLPAPSNSAWTVMGFVPALQHFHDVVAGLADNRSDLESAARTLETTELLWHRLESSWSVLRDE
ncbi:putative dehydrogenase [Streptomyces sp. SAI-135]|uniref:Gfo/Idh/MocA family protein n=1 Tax=unclassified Streptomyces TaxID=2593676 RepID=UPI002475F097|nr:MULTISPECIES: Gfo/Idh/MocA family oxidoreductase [unclassified Streptomyces]MDH6522804.1 putative dehydrogenase [Streptomyces sp. SAI-090]MDH6613581.1 putative dehydrogenase [Streptomyces sp. SAI-135]